MLSFELVILDFKINSDSRFADVVEYSVLLEMLVLLYPFHMLHYKRHSIILQSSFCLQIN